MNELVQPRKKMQMTVLLNAVLFSALLLAMGVCGVDEHYLLLLLLGVVMGFAIWAVGPVGYALEPKTGHRVRIHRPVGVVDLDLRNGFTVAKARRGAGGLVLAVGTKRYRLFGSLGSPELVDEWLRRASR
jgi:hypothetical protein